MNGEFLNYFAYGSNLSSKRLRRRTPSAQPRGIYTLPGYQLRFHKQGKDGSAKCDAFHTGASDDVVYGVLYTLSRREQPFLDLAEGVGVGYLSHEVTVYGSQQQAVVAMTYYAISINRRLSPFSWYKDHVLVGAREAGLPLDYIAKIQQIEAVEDPDCERELVERSIHLPFFTPFSDPSSKP